MSTKGFLCGITEPHSVITAIDNGTRLPDSIPALRAKYEDDIRYFAELVSSSKDSAHLLGSIRSKSVPAPRRMTLLKLFRRCVSGVCDTESTKKITAISTKSIVDAYGHTFKPISKLKTQFANLTDELLAVLSVSLGEYDTRGQQGYVLTGHFFDWFEDRFSSEMTIEGPRGAGPDIELSTVLDGFVEACPCDFIIRDKKSGKVLCAGFARYDSTRGGAQSDDRTGGNTGKVLMIRAHCEKANRKLRVLFLADGPGLAHKDTWQEACELDRIWDDNVRVTTLKLADRRVTKKWLRGTK
jgi:hypothetical protein